MAWIELSINTTHEAIDWVRTLLATTRYTGDINLVEYTRPTSQQTAEPSAEPSWDFTLCLYLPYDAHTNARLDEITQRLSSLQRTNQSSEPEVSVLDHNPAHTQSPDPFTHRVGQRFVVLAPDAPYRTESEDDILLKLKKTLAFGSGLHPTTIACLMLLERHIRPQMSGLDLGSGSGILSVAAAKLGAKVLALDNDRVAVQSTQEAVQGNQVEQQVTVMEGSLGQGSSLGHWMGGAMPDPTPIVEPTANADFIVANVFARIHIALADDFRRALRHTDTQPGLLIISGFTTDYEDEVTIALTEAGFKVIDRTQLGEWIAIALHL